MEKKFISVVFYLHNDADMLGGFLDTLIPTISDEFENYELIAVDDCCTDATVGMLKEYLEAKELKHMVNIVHMGFYQGVEAAMNAGRDAAIGDFVYEFDSVQVDYDASIIVELFNKSSEGYDIVKATGDSRKKLTSKIFYALYNKFSHGTGKIGSETFRLISRRAINRVKSMGQYIPYRKAVYANCGLNMTSILYKSVPTTKKKKHYSGERRKLAFDSFVYFTNVLEKISAFISGLFLIITVGTGLYIVTDYFNVNKPVEGWVSTMAFLSFGFFGVFMLLTIVLKYLSVLLSLEFKKQRYLVSDIEKVVSN